MNLVGGGNVSTSLSNHAFEEFTQLATDDGMPIWLQFGALICEFQDSLEKRISSDISSDYWNKEINPWEDSEPSLINIFS